jgi:hypothetical protein
MEEAHQDDAESEGYDRPRTSIYEMGKASKINVTPMNE